MMRVAFRVLVVVSSVIAASCGGGDGGSTATSPTPPAPVIPATAAATTVSQSGCTVTYRCPETDVNGNLNASVPTFEQITLTNGTSPTCRIDIIGGVPGETPIEFTIRNPNQAYRWGSVTTVNARLANSQTGTATAGPHSATLRLLGTPGFTSTGAASGGTTTVETLTMNLGPPNIFNESPVASCAVAVWGAMKSGGK